MLLNVYNKEKSNLQGASKISNFFIEWRKKMVSLQLYYVLGQSLSRSAGM